MLHNARVQTAHQDENSIVAKTPLTGDKIDAPPACAIPFHPYCADVAT